MKNKNTTTETTVETTAEQATETQAIEQVSGRKKVYKDQDFFPVCAMIMCACAAVGDLIGKYVFNDPETFMGYGMGIGIILAIVYIKKGGKQLDTSPTKERTKKQK